MWNTAPVKASRMRKNRRRSSSHTAEVGRIPGVVEGVASVVSSPPPRLAPLATASPLPSLSSSLPFVESTHHGGNRFTDVSRPHRLIANHRGSTSQSSKRSDTIVEASLTRGAPAMAAHAVGHGPARRPCRSDSHPLTGCSRGVSVTNGLEGSDGAPSSSALWRMNSSRPQLPRLATLSVQRHRPWPTESSWRRSKPLTRRLTTTVTAAAAAAAMMGGKGRQPLRNAQDSRAITPSSFRGPPTTTAGSGATTEEKGEDGGRGGAGAVVTRQLGTYSLTLSEDGNIALPRRPSDASERRVAAPHRVSALPLPCGDYDVDASPTDLPPSSADASTGAGTPQGELACVSVDVSTDGTALSHTSPLAAAAAEAGTAGAPSALPIPFLCNADDAAPSTYAQLHQLPQLFAEMVHDLALAQPLETTAVENTDGSGVVERWIQHWFLNRYDRAQTLPDSAPPSFAQQTQRLRDAATGHSAGTARESGSFDGRCRSKLASASPSTTSASSASSMSSVLSNRQFMPLSVQPCGAGTATATTATSVPPNATDDAILCASLDSTYHPTQVGGHCGSPLTLQAAPAPPPLPFSSSSLTPSVQHPLVATLAVAAKTDKTQSPPTSAGTTLPDRPPRPTSQQLLNAVKVNNMGGGGSSSLGGAAVTRPGSGSATFACATVGLLTSATAPEAAQTRKE
jgi:hypothetical protein